MPGKRERANPSVHPRTSLRFAVLLVKMVGHLVEGMLITYSYFCLKT